MGLSSVASSCPVLPSSSKPSRASKPLGSTAVFAPPPRTPGSDRGEAVALPYAFQSEARRLLSWHRVAVCLRARVAGTAAVAVWHRQATERVPASAEFGS